MFTKLVRELPDRGRLLLALWLLVVEALLNTVSITMLVPIGDAVLDESKPIDLAGIPLDFLPSNFTTGPNRVAWLLALLAVLIAAKVLAGTGKEFIAAAASRNIWAHWVEALTQGHLARPFAEQAQDSAGAIVNLAAREAYNASNLIVTFFSLISSVVTLVTMVVAMVLVEWRLVVGVFLAGALVYAVVLRPMLRKSGNLGRRSVSANQHLADLVAQTIEGAKDIILLNMQRTRVRVVREASRRAAGLDFKFSVLKVLPPYGLEFVFAAAVLLLSVLLFVTGPAGRDEWLPVILFFTAASFRLSTHAASAASNQIKVNNRYPSLRAVLDRVGSVPDLKAPQGGVPLDRISEPISIRNLSFSYPGGTPLFRSLDAEIMPDALSFLVGASGSGKSTLVDLIARLHTPASGTIQVHGLDYRDFKLRDWRHCLGYVSQHPVLFTGSIRDNVTVGDKRIKEGDIIDALRLAGALEFVKQLPDGLDTILGDGKHGLSGGQRCRLAIARALVRQPSILILDESTSGVEPQLERRILEDLKHIDGIGVLVVSHRKDNVDLADVVLELSNGSITRKHVSTT